MKQQAMKKQSGFTLIELVIVIIILGILAATAVPKFVDMQSDARKAAMKGVKGALESAASITYSKAAIDGNITKPTATANGVNIAYGYPVATAAALKEAAGISETDWTVVEATNTAIITAKGATSGALSTCKVTYKQLTSGTSTGRPSIVVLDTGC